MQGTRKIPTFFKKITEIPFQAILDPFSKILSYAIQNVVVESHVVVELCQLCGRAFSRDREKLALTRMLIIELVQALKFKTTMPDTNFITLINFVIQVFYLTVGKFYFLCSF